MFFFKGFVHSEGSYITFNTLKILRRVEVDHNRDMYRISLFVGLICWVGEVLHYYAIVLWLGGTDSHKLTHNGVGMGSNPC